MKSGVRLRLTHLVAFVAVALLLNAQFTWWVVVSLRESREWLDLERRSIVLEVETAALKLQLKAEEAARRLVLPGRGVIPAAGEAFPEVQVTAASEGEGVGWVTVSGRSAFVWPQGSGRVAVALFDQRKGYQWLAEIAPRLRLVDPERNRAEVPTVDLEPPFGRLAVAPDIDLWQDVLVRYRRRIAMVLGEGLLFLAGMVGAVLLLWMVLRREGARERSHQNFVSAITHELKTPIAGIRLAIETVLRQRADAEGSRHFLSNALADAERLSDLVQKVLEVTRYAGGAHRLRVAVGDLSQLVEEELTVAERRAEARGVILEADVAQGVEAPFDAEALPIVLSNLLENALKYAQGEPPRVRLGLLLEHGEAVIEVEDNGVGIEEGELESVFRPFYRSSDEITRRTPGTGIGLYVAREIVVAHGGRLTASSAGRGKGATFRLVLPGAELVPEEEFRE